ncbi:MAG: peptidoglycan bridge formation glycyltransferase FemA/FemB family protein [Parcubacteria group bacterium]|nr:peptidoglycan bridge formation glycyltransferase FemA/FemB family protein [Parcubacteria group bacterium]
MQIINLTDEKQLNDFVGREEHSQFLQSWQWGEFQQEVSGIIWRIGVEVDGQLVASAKLVKKQLPMGRSYFYCGRGPVGITNYELRITNYLFEEIEKIAKQESVMFLRFEPAFKIQNSKFKIIQTIDVQPSQTLILDLSRSEEELLKQMHQKTRYNIRLAEKKGVKIVAAGIGRFEEFWQLLVSTGDRDEFNLHGRSYYQAMLKLDSDFVKLFFAEYQGKPLAGNLMVFFGDTATYIHGGSLAENRETMAPYALQWHNIKLAKQLGYKYYDFHGVDEIKWPGVTRFKIGFGGKIINYPGTFDLVYDAGWYNIYKMVRKVRRTF